MLEEAAVELTVELEAAAEDAALEEDDAPPVPEELEASALELATAPEQSQAP